MNVTKSNGKKQEFSWEKIEAFYNRVNVGLIEKCPYSAIEQNLKTYLIEDITTENINILIIKSALDLISTENVSWSLVA